MVTNKDIQILNGFLEKRNVNYVLTGTAALFFHGLLPQDTEVHDIDIIVLTSDKSRSALQAMFNELENLSGCQNAKYTDIDVYTFKIGENNVKVNVFERNLDKESCPKFHTTIVDSNHIRVHDAMEALNAKFALHRQKDSDFCLKLINQLTSMFLCSKK